MIKQHPKLRISDNLVDFVKDMKVCNIDDTKFQAEMQKKYCCNTADELKFKTTVEWLTNCKTELVYFAAPKGCAPHIDRLDKLKYTHRTFIIPIICEGRYVLYTHNDRLCLKTGCMFEINHELTHGVEHLEVSINDNLVVAVFSELI